MRHFIATRPVATRSIGMSKPPQTTGLVTPSRQVLLASPRSPRAVARAVDLAAITATADQSLGATVRAKKQPRRRRVTVFGPANAKWTDATIARIMPLHAACVPSTVWGTASRRNSQVGLGAVLALENEQALSRHPPRVSPSQPQRARPPANGTHSSTKSPRKPPLRQPRSVGRCPSLKASSRHLNADSRRRRQRFQNA